MYTWLEVVEESADLVETELEELNVTEAGVAPGDETTTVLVPTAELFE